MMSEKWSTNGFQKWSRKKKRGSQKWSNQFISAIIFAFPFFLLTHNQCPKLYTLSREEQDLLEILDLELFGVKTLVLILIEPSLATFVLLDSCLVWRKKLKILLDSCLVRNRYLQSCLILAWRYFENWILDWTYLDRFDNI